MKRKKNKFWFAVILVVCGVGFMNVQPCFAEEDEMTLTIQSTAFVREGEIPTKYTCEGEDVSPALEWIGVPENAKSLVLIVDDPDAPDPDAPKMTWVHWVVYNVPPATNGFPEGTTAETIPDGARNGINDWKRTGYGGPCPPIGRHRYFFKLYALDIVLQEMNDPTKADVLAMMDGHVITETVMMGTYKKVK